MRIVVAMSGGVDSSVAAALLAEQGHDVIGVSMQLYDQGQTTAAGQKAFGTCCTIDDLYDARRVAATIGIPHYIVNFESQFGEHVIANFVREYVSGRTPIPCSHCNSELKFAELLDRAKAYDADQLATGHYARIEQDASGRYHLHRGADNSKDQTYFLFSLTQPQLARAAFPVGHLDKDTVRAHAHRLKLRVASKLATTVTVVHRRDSLRASKVMQDKAMSMPNISFIWNTEVVDIKDLDKGEVTSLVLKNTVTGAGSELAVDGVFIGIGHVPNTALFKGQLALHDNGYLKTHAGSRTSVSGVFAAGDVQDHIYRQAVTAAGSGCMAAIDAERFLSGTLHEATTAHA